MFRLHTQGGSGRKSVTQLGPWTKPRYGVRETSPEKLVVLSIIKISFIFDVKLQINVKFCLKVAKK